MKGFFWIISKGTYLITQLGTYKPIYLKVPQSGRLGIILTATPHGSGFSANRSSLAYKSPFSNGNLGKYSCSIHSISK